MEEILRKLVAFPTVSGNNQATHECMEYIDMFLQSRGMFVERFVWNGFESLVATSQPHTTTPAVMLGAHLDVVPAEDDMFVLRKHQGRYIGRGVLDMKFAIAAYLQLADRLQDTMASYDFGIMVTSDEEVGGSNGVARLVEAGYIPEVLVLPDGGDNWNIQTSSKGFLAFEISANGKTAHGSRPWQGENAIAKLLSVYGDIHRLFPRQQTTDTNTLSLNRITGGEAMNQVPHQASMSIDIRTIDSANHNHLYKAVTAICHQAGLVCSDISGAAPTNFSLQDAHIAPFAALVAKHTGVAQSGFRALGSSDVRFYVPYGTPCISVYPEGGDLHSAGEWLSVQALQQFYDILASYMELAGRRSSPQG